MPKGFHTSHRIKRSYIGRFNRLTASSLKPLINTDAGNYNFVNSHFKDSLSSFVLMESSEWEKVLVFKIDDRDWPVPFVLDSTSASKKLYLICPCCSNKRQYLLEFSNGFACRVCLNLNYASQSESYEDRCIRRIRKIRRKIWGNEMLTDDLFLCCGWFPKPKWKRWDVFSREVTELGRLERAYWRHVVEKYSWLGVSEHNPYCQND